MTRMGDACLRNDHRLESFENDTEFRIASDALGNAKAGTSAMDAPALAHRAVPLRQGSIRT